MGASRSRLLTDNDQDWIGVEKDLIGEIVESRVRFVVFPVVSETSVAVVGVAHRGRSQRRER